MPDIPVKSCAHVLRYKVHEAGNRMLIILPLFSYHSVSEAPLRFYQNNFSRYFFHLPVRQITVYPVEIRMYLQDLRILFTR